MHTNHRLTDIPQGPRDALTEALVDSTTLDSAQPRLREPLLVRLAKPGRRVLIVAWCGELDPDRPLAMDDFDPDRGDGWVHLAEPGEPLYRLPIMAGNPPMPVTYNPRISTPLWLLHCPPSSLPFLVMNPEGVDITVLATGAVHPLFCSATVDVYHPHIGSADCRRYLVLEREGQDLTADEQMAQLEDMSAGLNPGPKRRPDFHALAGHAPEFEPLARRLKRPLRKRPQAPQ